MKKSKIWIHVCVHLLLSITLGVYSSEFVNPVTDDITKLSQLKQNIPKDYKIPVHYIPKEESGMCWVKLNIFYLEESLIELSLKFGNISSNKYDISIFIQMLQDIRFKMRPLEALMLDFECHYRKERWQTGRYFELVEDFLRTASQEESRRDLTDCEPPSCPTITTTTTTTTTTTKYSTVKTTDCDDSTRNCKSWNEPLRFLPDGVEQSLLSLLLLIPIAAIVFLLVWKVKARRNDDSPGQNSVDGVLFTGTEGNSHQLTDESSERNRLTVIETV
ncbi:kit ligand a isoform X1 [Hypomesus transpacificus]|uniref:kit ligand a isoform X1 n=1 Tax=Hypomesus transpacificus TaxID=137520 RepID=UPI001F072598|nr:kit ligand a isoform X1 [Hypomesus transpacificus]